MNTIYFHFFIGLPDRLSPIDSDENTRQHVDTNSPLQQQQSDPQSFEECKVCSKKFNSEVTLDIHNRLYHRGQVFLFEKYYSCPPSVTNMMRNLKEYFVKPRLEIYICNICLKVFTSLRYLGENVSDHSGDKPHQCKVCDKRYASLHNLMKHIEEQLSNGSPGHKCMTKHSGEGPSEANGLCTSDGQLPNHSGEGPSEANGLCTSDGQLPHHSGEGPSEANGLCTSDGQLPNHCGEGPSETNGICTLDGQLPNHCGEGPSETNGICNLDGQLPHHSGEGPSETNKICTSDEQLRTHNGEGPSETNGICTLDGQLPHHSGEGPSETNKICTSDEQLRTHSGEGPSETNGICTSDGQTPSYSGEGPSQTNGLCAPKQHSQNHDYEASEEWSKHTKRHNGNVSDEANKLSTSNKPIQSHCDEGPDDRNTVCSSQSNVNHELQHQCLICKKKFASNDILDQHTQEHLDKWERQSNIDYRIPRENQDLDKPSPAHKHNFEILCETCRFTYHCKYCLKKHSRANPKRMFICEYCSECFNNQCAIKVHIKKHANKRWKCGLCGKTFEHRENLALHIEVHEIKQAHKCTECLELFEEKSALTYHMATHIEEFPYTCPTCGEQFVLGGELKRHCVRFEH